MFMAIVERTIALASRRAGTLLGTGWAYMLLLLAVNLALSNAVAPGASFTTGSYMTEPLATSGAATGDRVAGLRILALLANVLIGFSIAVAYTRRILIDARDFFLVANARTLKVIFNQILLALIGLLALIPLFLIAGLVGLITAGAGFLAFFAAPFVALMLVQRFSMILPAAAVDDPLTLRDSWTATRGMGWAMAFAALLASAVLACLVGLWALLLYGIDALLPADPVTAQLRSAAFPMGTMTLAVWVFASLHATCYGLIRERFAEKVGLTRDIRARADARREAARAVRVARLPGRAE
ncbi:hypothetical protein [Polymorphum gilvum]|uniref:4-hydroxy-3-methylbut-2-en-1-yl diphosphate synthase n=1 Tax=Polymorphum gilvum (strain LMG 25793 / CGMCC 1.9160 / SL003B-26A1) TaxID=991905 RepID=F2J207_POLGS|nr:hypothetical protein [Polymorphum gilvum]ADZ68767.1 4-hydroxy-3-methylbut-2-en-1-yl diphosphate synthase [Polymorphum gilvum SL003B-26A1]